MISSGVVFLCSVLVLVPAPILFFISVTLLFGLEVVPDSAGSGRISKNIQALVLL